jgi:hypothetical protein
MAVSLTVVGACYGKVGEITIEDDRILWNRPGLPEPTQVSFNRVKSFRTWTWSRLTGYYVVAWRQSVYGVVKLRGDRGDYYFLVHPRDLGRVAKALQAAGVKRSLNPFRSRVPESQRVSR